jgi:hypothetical protein
LAALWFCRNPGPEAAVEKGQVLRGGSGITQRGRAAPVGRQSDLSFRGRQIFAHREDVNRLQYEMGGTIPNTRGRVAILVCFQRLALLKREREEEEEIEESQLAQHIQHSQHSQDSQHSQLTQQVQLDQEAHLDHELRG